MRTDRAWQIIYNISGWTGGLRYNGLLETKAKQTGQHTLTIRTDMADKIQYVRMDRADFIYTGV